MDDPGIALQNIFIAANPNELGKKDELLKPDDTSLYGILHKRYHPSFREFLQRFGFYDIALVESEKGYLVYSVIKGLDFATS